MAKLPFRRENIELSKFSGESTDGGATRYFAAFQVACGVFKDAKLSRGCFITRSGRVIVVFSREQATLY